MMQNQTKIKQKPSVVFSELAANILLERNTGPYLYRSAVRVRFAHGHTKM